jgi:hypothetical protein
MELETEHSTILLSVDLRLMTAAEGGRHQGALSGYQPHLAVCGLFTSCPIIRADGRGTELPLGETIACTLHPLWSPLVRSRIHPGSTVYLYDGSRCVGTAFVRDVLDFDPGGPVASLDE